jgi:hypothetical protein
VDFLLNLAEGPRPVLPISTRGGEQKKSPPGWALEKPYMYGLQQAQPETTLGGEPPENNRSYICFMSKERQDFINPRHLLQKIDDS